MVAVNDYRATAGAVSRAFEVDRPGTAAAIARVGRATAPCENRAGVRRSILRRALVDRNTSTTATVGVVVSAFA